MASHPHPSPADVSAASMHTALLDALYCDMLVLADEVRAGPPPAAAADAPLERVRIACEHLRLSARLMRMTQLLLDHRAGRPVPPRAIDPLSAPLTGAALPAAVAEQLGAAARLEQRLADLLDPPPPPPPPVHDLQRRLAQTFD